VRQEGLGNLIKIIRFIGYAKLRWKEHIKEKLDELNIKFKKMYWLLGRNSELSLHNKLTSYKQVYVQFGVMVSSSGAAPVNLTSK
jgi:hypothetical protein